MVLETEYDNAAALSLYESLGFIREKRLYRFYLNGKDAFRLVLGLPPPSSDGEGSESDAEAGSQADFRLRVQAKAHPHPHSHPHQPAHHPHSPTHSHPHSPTHAHPLQPPRKTYSLLVPPVPIRFFPAIPYDSDDEVSSR